MSHRLEPLLDEIRDLEKLVSDRIHQVAETVPFQFENGKAVFDLETRRHHKTFVKRLARFIRESRLLTILTVPVIYALLIPIAMLDLFVCIYQWTCFPVYGIPAVMRGDYVVLDRHQLAYLNIIERSNCVYCGYANGVLAYAREVASLTEQYWCPIKHARRVKGCHARQCMFCEFGDAAGFRNEYESLRKQITQLRPEMAGSIPREQDHVDGDHSSEF